MFDQAGQNGVSRRDFFGSLFPSLAIVQLASRMANPSAGTFGIAYSSFPIRVQQLNPGAEEEAWAALSAEKFIDLCKSFGADGCQMHLSQLSGWEEGVLKRVKKNCEDKAMFLEFSVPSSLFKETARFREAASAMRSSGATCLHTALGKLRYEMPLESGQRREFVEGWRKALQSIAPVLEEHQLYLGIENHQDWTSEELAEFLGSLKSPHIGACFDFGNSVSLLEDPWESVQILAPYTVTTHMKDIALNVDEDSFSWGEVPLGQGILPLTRILEILRRARPKIHFCLEMATRDPIRIEFASETVRTALPKVDEKRLGKFKEMVLSRASAKPLVRVSGMSSARMLATEDDNIRRSVAYSKRTLGL